MNQTVDIIIIIDLIDYMKRKITNTIKNLMLIYKMKFGFIYND